MYQLEAEDPLGRKMIFPLVQAKTTIGREPGCDIVLEDDEVSRQHAIIGIIGDTIKLRDHHSTNGVFINNERVTDTVELKAGDEIIIGANMFHLREAPAAAAGINYEPTIAVSEAELAAEVQRAQERQAADAASGLSVGSSSGAWNATMALDKEAILKAIYRKQLNLHRYNSLEVISGPDKGKKYLLKKGEQLIGRGTGCHIQLSDPHASKEHGVIKVDDRGVTYTDRDSANGSKLNNETVTTAGLHNRDLLEIGNTQLKCVVPRERQTKQVSEPEAFVPTASHTTFKPDAVTISEPQKPKASSLKEYLLPLLIGIGVAIGVVVLLVLLGR